MAATVRIPGGDYDENVVAAVARLLDSMKVDLWFSNLVEDSEWEKYCDELTSLACELNKQICYSHLSEGVVISIS